ncbi:hypothetical protein BSKO_06023 [Bryopsis sp. KO-2023]|nr:hypothetical protein BSKO_06023 [Bryopsis sp. KO-2023]
MSASSLTSSASIARRPRLLNPSNVKADTKRCGRVSSGKVVCLTTEEKIKKLTAENLGLRAELARVQNVEPNQVSFSPVSKVEKTVQPKADQVEISSSGDEIRWPTPDESPPFWERPARTNAPDVSQNGSSEIVKTQGDSRDLYVMHITAEMAPIAKVGGLGDVVTGLARACLARGHHVEVVLPYYECLPEASIENLEHEVDFDCPKSRFWDGEWQEHSLKTSIWKGKIAGVQVFLVRPDWDSCNIFRGGRIYGGSYNELEAYLYFCRASLEFMKTTFRQPHILHIHEWQASAVALLYWEKYTNEGLNLSRIVLTIHNMDNSGECSQDEFMASGIHGNRFATVDKALDERTIGHNPERLNLLKGGIVYSSAVTTVSPTYADEILSGGAAGWLRGTLAKSEIRSKFKGVLNGIDTDEWHPALDPVLPVNFNSKSPQGKAQCKEYLQKGLGLSVDADKPLVVCVTRLVPQKGVHLIVHAVHRSKELGGQMVLLGTGHADGDFRAMADGQYKTDPDIRLLLLYSEPLAHLIYAAADFVLVPSMFEPCGLTQMIAMRYGALPIVRRTGGLADTVIDLDAGDGNGFVFDGVDEGSLDRSLTRAFGVFRDDREKFNQVSHKNMDLDFSWEKSAASYVQTYESVTAF